MKFYLRFLLPFSLVMQCGALITTKKGTKVLNSLVGRSRAMDIQPDLFSANVHLGDCTYPLGAQYGSDRAYVGEDRSEQVGASSPFSVMYKFSRPHTIKGTIIASVMAVVRALIENPAAISWKLVPKAILGLLALLCGNAYIVGINQIFDVKIDEINKPFLPIAAKMLSPEAAWAIIISCLVAGVTIVKTHFSRQIFALYILGTTLGTIYSIPPFQFKRIPVLAGGIIATVRGFLLNFGVYYAVREALGISFRWNPVVTFISAFMTVFASVIAITKV